MSDVYQWFDAFGELAARQRETRMKWAPELQPQMRSEAAKTLIKLCGAHGVGQVRDTMLRLGGVGRLPDVPEPKLDFVLRVKADLEGRQ